MTSLSVFMASMPFTSINTEANSGENILKLPDHFEPVFLRPLNSNQDNLFAAHRSHSSHSSHRSSSGGSSYRSPTPAPAPAAPSQNDSNPSGNSFYGSPGSSQPVDQGRAAPVSPIPARKQPAPLSTSEKLMLQVMRVQISLTSLGIYSGSISGELDKSTKESIRRFQIVKGIEPNGLMSTETLNALGVPAVQ